MRKKIVKYWLNYLILGKNYDIILNKFKDYEKDNTNIIKLTES